MHGVEHIMVSESGEYVYIAHITYLATPPDVKVKLTVSVCSTD